MKAIVVVAIALISTTALAGPWSRAQSRLDFCDAVGQASKIAYSNSRTQIATNGKHGKSREVLYKEWDFMMNQGDKGDAIFKFAIDYAYDGATDRDNAYKTSWANCMDRTE